MFFTPFISSPKLLTSTPLYFVFFSALFCVLHPLTVQSTWLSHVHSGMVEMTWMSLGWPSGRISISSQLSCTHQCRTRFRRPSHPYRTSWSRSWESMLTLSPLRYPVICVASLPPFFPQPRLLHAWAAQRLWVASETSEMWLWTTPSTQILPM